MKTDFEDVAERQDPCKLQDAKARFSELERLASEAGSQRVMVNGKEKAVILSAEDYRRLCGEPKGDVLVQRLAEAELIDVEFGQPKTRGPVRDVAL
ncbi:type II toxin-antitoxin system prevent-host-death family antitoxin [Halochromatium salexigens]|uniref:Antitoxin n=1 Tax=Halochromatium salexigens TaxID=49447 RepID=A0AAJ0UDY5_HALSE|nr:hypothetical protein [Halochromatium salexigens]